MKRKLTKPVVDGIKANGCEQWAWDSELDGFGVRVHPSGRKTYIVRYRVKGTRVQRKQVVARCTDVTPDKAREMARKIFASVADGGDPMAERRAIVCAPMMTDLMMRYMDEHARPRKKPRSVELDEKNWRLHILPAIGQIRVSDIKESHVITMHGKLSVKPATANQVIALMSKAFNLAEKWDWRARNTNPCHGIEKYKITQRELILNHEQVKNLGNTLATMEATGKIPKPMADLVRLLMITGCRLREIMHAETAWIDRQRSLLLLPDSKVGQRKIPMSSAAMTIVGEHSNGRWIIPSADDNMPMTAPYAHWKKIKDEAGLPEEFRIHDLRHTAGSLGHMAGLTQKQIQMMLGHKQMSTTERYLHGAGDNADVAEKMSSIIAGNWSVIPAGATIQ